MYWLVFIILFLFCSIEALSADTFCKHDQNTFKCVSYVRNYDGDTIVVNIPNVHPIIGENISIRIKGIDTPEIKTNDKCERDIALKAWQIVKNILITAHRIDLENIKRDKYFRIDADVIADGISLQKIMLKEKLAYPYNHGKKQKIDWCKGNIQGFM
jgi:endonuclease YncB( thermonuclease family)